MLKLTAEQQAIVNAVVNGQSCLVRAYAGCSKTTTLEQSVKALQASAPKTRGLMVAFNVRVKGELISRLGESEQWKVMTLNGLGHRTIMLNSKQFNNGNVQLVPGKAFAIAREVTMQDRASAVIKTALTRPKNGPRGAINTVEVLASLLDITRLAGLRSGAVTHESAATLLQAAIERTERDVVVSKNADLNGIARILNAMLERNLSLARVEGKIDFNDQIYLATRYCAHHGRPWDTVMVDEMQDLSPLNTEQLLPIAAKQLVAVGDEHQCQPAGTKVRMLDGRVKNIEDIEPGDNHVTWSDKMGRYYGLTTPQVSNNSSHRRPAPLPRIEKTAKRWYEGPMLRFTTLDTQRSSRYTPEHRIPVRRSRTPLVRFHVYLMVKGDKARVGMTSGGGGDNGGHGVLHRAIAEKADKMWILKSFASRSEALQYESIMGARYGIPQQVFDIGTELSVKSYLLGDQEFKNWRRTKSRFIAEFWSYFGNMRQKAKAAVSDHAKLWDHPAYDKANPYARFGSKKKTTFIAACNVIPGYHEVRTFAGVNSRGNEDSQWEHVTVSSRAYKGYVYSLRCSTYTECYGPTYIADGIWTHNSIYQFRSGTAESIEVLRKAWEQKAGKPMLNLPLKVTFRCPIAVVERQAKIVPVKDFKAFNRKKGTVTLPYPAKKEAWTFKRLLANHTKQYPNGRAVLLARTNAELVLALLMAYAEGLTPDQLAYGGRVPTQEDINVARSRQPFRAGTSPGGWEGSLVFTCSYLGSKKVAPREFFESFAAGGDARTGYFKAPLTLSTIHGFKGLEADTVFLLNPNSSIGRTGNLRYIAETRTRDRLFGASLLRHARAASTRAQLQIKAILGSGAT